MEENVLPSISIGSLRICFTFLCYKGEGRLLEQFILLLCNPIRFHQVSLLWHQLERKILVRLSSIAGSYHVITNRL